ncbi:MAG: hypothetical protein IIC85_09030 [Chloroflexi bacterium]|nr:hypothetical protein [Chloroflexota bacterium]
MPERIPKIAAVIVVAAVVSIAGLLITSRISWATQAEESAVVDVGQPSGEPAFVRAAPSNKIYWADIGSFTSNISRVRRANLDGSVVEDVVTDRFRVNGVALDLAGGKIYWTENSGPWRADFDGGDVANVGVAQQLHAVASSTIFVDIKNGKVYWASPAQAKVQRANLDGSNAERNYALFFPLAAQIAVDPIGGRLYWASLGDDPFNPSTTDGKILRSITLEPPPGLGPRLNREGDPDGNFEIIVPAPASSTAPTLNDPVGLALDLSAGKVYWVDKGAGKIQRSNLDGSSPEDVVTGLSKPNSIALDPINGHMYWTDQTDLTIARADMADGSNQQDILTGLNDPWGLTLDVDRCPALSGGTTPLDNDADWRCEDTNANGRRDFQDVVKLFLEFSSPEVQNDQFYFDFNGNNGVDFGDVVTLFEDLAKLVGVLP